jgi:lysozyme
MNNYKTGSEGVRLVTSFEGDPRLVARLCEGNRYEVGYGCTFWPDGTPVQRGAIIQPQEVEPLLLHALGTFEVAVRRHLKVEVSQNQFDALVAFTYNVGEGNLSDSKVLRFTNERRFEDAAAAFGLWVKATSVVDARGNPWLSPDGQPCSYRRALRGLLRRHYAEACVYSGFDWDEACADASIALRSEKVWEAENNRWHDRVLWDQTTPWAQVLEVARRSPLPLILSKPVEHVTVVTDVPKPAPIVGAEKYVKKVEEFVAPKPAPPPPPKPVVVAAPPPPPPPEPVGTKKKSPNTVDPAEVPYKIDKDAGLKPLEESERAKGFWYQQAGIGLIKLGTLGVFGTTVQGASAVVQQDPVISNLVLTGVVVGGIAVTGFVVKSYGDWKRKRGEKAATQGLY